MERFTQPGAPSDRDSEWEPLMPQDKPQGGRVEGGGGVRGDGRGGLLWDPGTTNGDAAEEVFQGMELVKTE